MNLFSHIHYGDFPNGGSKWIIFVVLPVILTLYQLHKEINKWKRINDELSEWINKHINLLYTFSVITGLSFTGVKLCTSNLFNLNQFDIPLNEMDLNKFQTKKMYSIVLCEV